MPILWRFLLSQYLKVFLLTATAFIGVLLVSRLDEIAHFAALGGTARFVAFFTLHQIPYVLPIAIPISALVSATLLFQNLSLSHELTAMRASGISLPRILTPILVTSAFLSVLNFYVISEGATYSHLATRRLESEVRATNPLLFLQNRRLLQSRGIYGDVRGRFRNGEFAEDVVLGLYNESNERLSVILFDRLIAGEGELSGENITMITATPGSEPHLFDHLIVENIESGRSSIEELSQLVRKKGWSLKPDHLQASLLLVKLRAEALKVRELSSNPAEKESLAYHKDQLNRTISEFSRRGSLSLAVFCFTLMGCAFGITISRDRSLKGMAVIVGMTALYLSCFFLGKRLDRNFILSTLSYLFPLVVVVMLSLRALHRVNRGEGS